MKKPSLLLYLGIGIGAYLFTRVAMGEGRSLQGQNVIISTGIDTYLQTAPNSHVGPVVKDGTHATVIDGGAKPGEWTNWIQIRDESGRTGWVQEGMVRV